MRLKDVVEVLYLGYMLRWERTAPPDGHKGERLDGTQARNTQISRLVRVLTMVAAGAEERVFKTLEARTRRTDGNSYISRDQSWMREPAELYHGWFFEGCTSLEQKREILEPLRFLGLSSDFVAATFEFVAGRPLEKFVPTPAEQDEIVRKREERLIEQGYKFVRDGTDFTIETPYGVKLSTKAAG